MPRVSVTEVAARAYEAVNYRDRLSHLATGHATLAEAILMLMATYHARYGYDKPLGKELELVLRRWS